MTMPMSKAAIVSLLETEPGYRETVAQFLVDHVPWQVEVRALRKAAQDFRPGDDSHPWTIHVRRELNLRADKIEENNHA